MAKEAVVGKQVTCANCGWSWSTNDSSPSDKYICHTCGKDNENATLKNGGWLNKYNDAPEAQNGIEGTMGGLTDKGFNYNGAWGGTMAMGGSLPGAVGFTYARTQSPAPSNGPYAKKTKASAQRGKNVKPIDNSNITNEVINYTKEYMNSPMYKQMLSASAKNEDDANTIQLNRNLNLDSTIVNFPEKQRQYNLYGDSKSSGLVNIYPLAQRDNITGNVIAHEVSHSVDRPISSRNRIIPQSDIDLISEYSNSKGRLFDRFSKYTALPTETRAQLNNIRYDAKSSNLYDPFTEKVTPEILEKIKNSKTKNGYGDLKDVYSDDQIINLLNTISKNNQPSQEFPIAQNGMEMKYYQEGLDWKPKNISKDGGWLSKYEGGGIIEDDMGQWAHPGEITKINSNQITMQGVDYPVLGISDTGDTKMMQPGEDYTYDGESVTEYPMMQPGGKVKFGQKQKPDPFYNPLEYYQYTGKPIKQPWMPGDEKIKISDKRTMNAAANAAIRPNKDLVTGKYDADRISNIASVAKLYGIDPNLLLSIDLQETGFGTIGEDPGSESIGHTKGYNLSDLKTPSKRGSDEDVFDDRYDFFARAYLEKMAEGKRQGLTDSLDIIQNYNGRGIVTPYTELDYHGFPMKEIYGVPLPEKGISMKQNPLYGKRIFDLRENVVKQNPDLQRLINLAKPTNKPVIEKSQMFEMPASNKKENGGWLNKYK